MRLTIATALVVIGALYATMLPASAYDLGMYCKGCGVSTGGNVPSRPPQNDNN